MIRFDVTNEYSDLGKKFQWTSQLIVIISLVIHFLKTVPSIYQGHEGLFKIIEIIIFIIFIIEYVLRFLSEPSKLHFVLSLDGLADAVVLIPFILFGVTDFDFVKAIRLMNLLKPHYPKSFRRYHRAYKLIRDELKIFLVFVGISLYISAAGIYYFENEVQPQVFKSMFHTLWWAICTLTTVGYGDVYPVTPGGKFFTFFVLIISILTLAVPSALFSAALSKGEIEDDKW